MKHGGRVSASTSWLAGVALVVAVLAYLAWIPAVADNAHPVLATAAGMVGFGAVAVLIGALVKALLDRRGRVRPEKRRLTGRKSGR